jgi:hypothetical protein
MYPRLLIARLLVFLVCMWYMVTEGKGGGALEYAKFKSKFINDTSQYCNGKFEIPVLKNALDRAVEEELPSRDNNKSFQIRDLTNSESLKISYNSPYLMCKYSSEKECVLVGTLAPAWSRGWQNISKDAFVSDIIDTFFHFASQYIYRSYQINLIGAIALTYGKHCDFRGNEFQEYWLPFCSHEYIAFRNNIPTTRNKRNHTLECYLDLVNSFDPVCEQGGLLLCTVAFTSFRWVL